MRQRGKITVWKSSRGFGFIHPDDGGQDVFLHVGEIDSGYARLHARVEYDVTVSDRGPKALHAKVLGGNNGGTRRPPGRRTQAFGPPEDDRLADVLTVEEFQREVLEPALIGHESWDAVVTVARGHGWVE